MELWEQCVEWLKSAGVIHRNEMFGKLADFAAILRNGVVLCELALRLKPGSIDRRGILVQYQQSPFTCSKNIALFLYACRRHFGISEMFSEDDLYGLENFGAVLRPFPEETTLPSELDEDNNIYSNLREEVERSHGPPQYAIINKRHDTDEDEDGRKLYDTICGQKPTKINDNDRTLPITYSEFIPTHKHEHILKEMLDTENRYVSALQRIVDVFYNRLSFHLNTEDMSTIFINIRDILKLNLDFLAQLQSSVLRALDIDCVCKEEPLKIADLFISFKGRFTIYGKYCSLLGASMNRTEELERTEPEFKKTITELAKANDGQFGLNALLCIPFQRITRYHLLLEHLTKYTQDVAEQASLNGAYDCMKDVCEYVNEIKRDHDAIEFINTIERSISALDLKLLDYGRLLCDDFVKVVAKCSSSKQRYVFLFEKMIMFCKREGGFYKKKGHILLCDFELLENELEANNAKGTHTLSRKLTNSFFDNISLTIGRRESAATTTPNSAVGNDLATAPINNVQLVFKSVKQRDEWKEAVRKAIDVCNPRGAISKGHSLMYKTYTDVTVCSICQMLLRGKFFQGYHCSGCNRNMHYECASMKECVIGRSADFMSLSKTFADLNGGTAPKTTPTCAQNFFPGEIVVSRQSIPPNGTTNRLSCQNGDFIELLEVNSTDGTALGRLSNQPQMVGTISLDGLVKRATTLEERMRRRPSRSLNDSLSEVITLQSPVNRISSPPALEIQRALPPAAISIVSSHIITLSEHLHDVTEQPWYFGELGRGEARELLEHTEEGTFIVRWSSERQQFAISFSAGAKRVKHVKIEYCSEKREYYLYDTRFFDSIVELVNFYRTNSLREGFDLDTMLKGTPLKGCTYRAVSAYSRPDSSRYLTLKPGDIVTVLDTAGDKNGWWKGSINYGEMIGFFPVSYVEKVPKLGGVRPYQTIPPPPPPPYNNNNGQQTVYQNNNLITADVVVQRDNERRRETDSEDGEHTLTAMMDNNNVLMMQHNSSRENGRTESVL